jgi:hypothetical protein
MSDEPPRRAALSEVTSLINRLDPNMLAVLLLTITLNGMFFYVYMSLASSRHAEFIAALNACPAFSAPTGGARP